MAELVKNCLSLCNWYLIFCVEIANIFISFCLAKYLNGVILVKINYRSFLSNLLALNLTANRVNKVMRFFGYLCDTTYLDSNFSSNTFLLLYWYLCMLSNTHNSNLGIFLLKASFWKIFSFEFPLLKLFIFWV